MTFASALTFVAGIAVGVMIYDVQLERHQPSIRWVNPCPPANAAGHALVSSMSQESYVRGEPRVHECFYGR